MHVLLTCVSDALDTEPYMCIHTVKLYRYRYSNYMSLGVGLI